MAQRSPICTCRFFVLSLQPIFKKTMHDTYLHTDPDAVPESSFELMLRGFSGMVHQQEVEKYHLQQRCAQYEAQMQALPADSIVAEGKQKELIAILNAIYESGLITGNKKDFMQRMAAACGCESIANYPKALYNIKNTYKYDEIFKNLAEVAHNEILKND